MKNPHIIEYYGIPYDLEDTDDVIKLSKMGYFAAASEDLDFYDQQI